MLHDNAFCAAHPGVRAVEVCARCGSFVCGSCMEIEDSQVYCPDCLPKVSKRAPHGGRATAAIVCGLLALNGCVFLGPVAILLGHVEMAAIDRGESPHSGRNLAKGGLILGYIGTVIGVGAVVIGVAIALMD